MKSFRVTALLLLVSAVPMCVFAGVIVERVVPESAGARAGLRAGDEIVSLAPAPGRVEGIDSAFDFARAELDYSQRAAVTATVVTSGTMVPRTVQPGWWGIVVRSAPVPAPGQDDALVAAVMRGSVAFERWDLDAARDAWMQAEGLVGNTASAEWMRAQIRTRLAAVATLKGDLAGAQSMLNEALEIQTRLAPESLAVADTKRALAAVHYERREIDATRSLLLEALALVDPMPRNNLVWVEIQLRLAQIEMLTRTVGSAVDLNGAYELARTLQPRSILVSRLLTTLGARALEAGDLELGEELMRQALAIAQETAPGTLAEGGNLMNLGNVHLRRHDHAAAQREYEKAAAIFERISPGSPAALRALSNVAMAAGAGDAPEYAITVLERVLAIQQRTQPDSLDSAHSYNALGLNYQRVREPGRAVHAFERALTIKQRQSPNAMTTAVAHENLGMALREVAQLDRAATHHRVALTMFQQIMPGTTHEAESLHSLGLIERARERRDTALQFFAQAIRAVEQQERRLGGSREVRAGFAAYYGAFYKDYLDLLLKAGREEDAFDVLERYRARVLSAMLAERRASPKNAKWPEPTMTARDVIAKLPGGRVLLSYSVGERELKIFAIRGSQVPGSTTAPRMRVFTISVSAAQLQQEVAAWRDLLRSPEAARADSHEAKDLAEHGQRLREWLLDPADELLAGSDHWIILADGPLHLFPITALPASRRMKERTSNTYVAQRVRVTTAISATLYFNDSQEQIRASTPRILALGDPAYPTDGQPQLPRLQGTQVELHSIRRIYGDDAQVYSGREATERRARAIPPQTRYIHYAVHGVLDDRAPFDSYLAFVAETSSAQGRTTPAIKDRDGRLQAWEIVEHVRLAADLVILSACDTALGMDAAGEGLMGLTRAFQYAGAGAVLASLWEAPDRSTSMFMTELHRRIRAGEPVESALHATQKRFVSDPAFRIWSHPLHWAGFQLSSARPESY